MKKLSRKKEKPEKIIPDNLDEYIHRSEYKVLFLKYWAIRKAYAAIKKKHDALKIATGIELAPKRPRKRTSYGAG